MRPDAFYAPIDVILIILSVVRRRFFTGLRRTGFTVKLAEKILRRLRLHYVISAVYLLYLHFMSGAYVVCQLYCRLFLPKSHGSRYSAGTSVSISVIASQQAITAGLYLPPWRR
ncbi:hypothetical protein KCP73_13835 [Salmonella enterica subsp. enterica]|nr:hypothetical protein KCP73_13835 [Salmonella enterica subsp. enterica]